MAPMLFSLFFALALSPSLSLSAAPASHLHAALLGGLEAARVLGVRGVGPAGLPPGVERVLEERRGRRRSRGKGDERHERDGQRASHLGFALDGLLLLSKPDCE